MRRYKEIAASVRFLVLILELLSLIAKCYESSLKKYLMFSFIAVMLLNIEAS